MNIMKSIQIKRYSGSEVMKVNNVASEPNPSSGKILVNAKASGVNPIDWKIREGNMQQMITLQFPIKFWNGLFRCYQTGRRKRTIRLQAR
jgi:NADPH:quinone reductase-like Zn-dependent oxidoreductase